MKAKLEFTLPEDSFDYRRMSKVDDICSFMWEFQQYLRTQVKYAEKPDDAEAIYKKWFEMLHDEDLDMDKLMQ